MMMGDRRHAGFRNDLGKRYTQRDVSAEWSVHFPEPADRFHEFFNKVVEEAIFQLTLEFINLPGYRTFPHPGAKTITKERLLFPDAEMRFFDEKRTFRVFDRAPRQSKNRKIQHLQKHQPIWSVSRRNTVCSRKTGRYKTHITDVCRTASNSPLLSPNIFVYTGCHKYVPFTEFLTNL